MCMITYVPPTLITPVAEIWNGTTINKDGYGWAIATETDMIKYWSLDPRQAITKFVDARKTHFGPSLFHSRFATRGSVNLDNCHPFTVGTGMVVAHNGTFHDVDVVGDETDTEAFVRAHNLLWFSLWSSDDARNRIEKAAGWSRLVALKVGEPNGVIINADAGFWEEDGCWHSNDGYMPWGRQFDDDMAWQ